MKIAVTRRIQEPELARLSEVGEVDLWDIELPPSNDELIELLSNAGAALTLLTDRINGNLLDSAPNLRVVSNLAVGYDNIDLDAATARGIAVCTTPDVLTDTTAEFTFALIFAAARHLKPAVNFAAAGEWKTWYPLGFLGKDLKDSTLGVVGLGRIGARVAEMGAALGMKVVYSDPFAEDVRFTKAEVADVISQADILTLHAPLLDETRGLLNVDTLMTMKPDAVLINTARGPIIDTDALVQVLNHGRLLGVGLDVTDPEPLPSDHPLYSFDRVIIAPHIASATTQTRNEMARLAVDNILSVLDGTEPPNCLNPEVLE